MNLKHSLTALNEGFKDKMKAAALATAIGASTIGGAQAQSQDGSTPTVSHSIHHHQVQKIEDYMDDLQDLIEQNEGRSSTAYVDTRGNPTIGVGFNLNRSDAHRICKTLGLDFAAVKSGQVALTDDQIDRVFHHDVANSVKIARDYVDGFNTLPIKVQMCIVDLCFNLGEAKFREFDKFLTKIEHHNFRAAATDLRHTLWFKQTGNRGERTVEMLVSAAY